MGKQKKEQYAPNRKLLDAIDLQFRKDWIEFCRLLREHIKVIHFMFSDMKGYYGKYCIDANICFIDLVEWGVDNEFLSVWVMRPRTKKAVPPMCISLTEKGKKEVANPSFRPYRIDGLDDDMVQRMDPYLYEELFEKVVQIISVYRNARIEDIRSQISHNTNDFIAEALLRGDIVRVKNTIYKLADKKDDIKNVG